jgi:hypothetical protein
MCFGGGGRGKSAEQYYEEMKPAPIELPSLRVDRVKRTGPIYSGVRQTQVERRSLLMPMGFNNG